MDIKEKAIYRYPKEFGGWARHGIVFTWRNPKDGKLWAINTYDDSTFNTLKQNYISQDNRCYLVDEIAEDLEFVMMIDDVKQVDSEVFWQYDNNDKIYFPIGMWHERYLVNKNARPNIDLQIEQLKDKIRGCEYQIESAQRNIKRYSQQLFELRCVKENLNG